jgi:hypothetical protein
VIDEYTPGLQGHITHTELASTDPDGTREWCAADATYRVALVAGAGRVTAQACECEFIV